MEIRWFDNHMVLELSGDAPTGDRLSAVFGALADPTRRAILDRLADGECTVAELTRPFAMSQPAISKHLKVLEHAGLITRSRRATARLSHLEAAPLKAATDWLARYREYWEESYERLDELLERIQTDRGPTQPTGPATHPSTSAGAAGIDTSDPERSAS
jgi:DNA-binding transcriptional ArsR family regulator